MRSRCHRVSCLVALRCVEPCRLLASPVDVLLCCRFSLVFLTSLLLLLHGWQWRRSHPHNLHARHLASEQRGLQRQQRRERRQAAGEERKALHLSGRRRRARARWSEEGGEAVAGPRGVLSQNVGATGLVLSSMIERSGRDGLVLPVGERPDPPCSAQPHCDRLTRRLCLPGCRSAVFTAAFECGHCGRDGHSGLQSQSCEVSAFIDACLPLPLFPKPAPRLVVLCVVVSCVVVRRMSDVPLLLCTPFAADRAESLCCWLCGIASRVRTSQWGHIRPTLSHISKATLQSILHLLLAPLQRCRTRSSRTWRCSHTR